PHGRARQGNGCNWSWKVTPCSMRGGRGLVDQDQVVAAYDGAAVVETEQPLDLLAVAAGDALQVAGVVLDQAAADAAALPADQVDQGVVAEVAFHPDDAARQQRGAALGQGLAGAVVDPQLATTGRLVAQPQLARQQAWPVRRDQGAVQTVVGQRGQRAAVVSAQQRGVDPRCGGLAG